MFEDAAHQWDSPAHRLALDCLSAGIERAHPHKVVRRAIDYHDETLEIDESTYDLSSVDNVFVVGGGNAAGYAASGLEHLLGDRIDGGAVVTDDPAQTERIEMLTGDHPVPSERTVENTLTMRQYADNATATDLVIAVLTGGGSALLTAPAVGIELDALQRTTERLLTSGADIHAINAVRKHLSQIKGGHLAEAAAPASVVGLVFSDVVGDDTSTVASGPTAPDETTFTDALNVLDIHDVTPPDSVAQRLARGAADRHQETPGPGNSAFEDVTNHVIVTGYTAVNGAAKEAEQQGVDAVILSSRIRGEAQEAALSHVGIVEEIRATDNPACEPVVVVSGGETTVTVDGNGTGGPNQEFALASARELPADTVLASVDTDGIDGATDVAGAIVDADTVDNDRRAGAALADNDAYGYLEERNRLLRPGPTGTNVNDLRVAVIGLDTECS